MTATRANTGVKLSVVLPCYNAADTIGEQLEALSKQEWEHPWEVIVVNNKSSDNTMEIVQQYEDKINNLVCVDAFDRPGAAYARNKGVENSNGDIIAFCDADDVVGKNWVASMGEALMVHDIVACKWNWSTLNDFSKTTLDWKAQPDELFEGPAKFLQPVGASTLGIKKSIHLENGGFDESLAYLEDIDYCWRLQLKGYDLTFISEAVVHMRARSSNFKIFIQELNWGEYDVYLHEKYKYLGIQKFTPERSLKSFYYLLRQARNLFSKEKRTVWLIRFGSHIGELKGMIKHKYLKISL